MSNSQHFEKGPFGSGISGPDSPETGPFGMTTGTPNTPLTVGGDGVPNTMLHAKVAPVRRHEIRKYEIAKMLFGLVENSDFISAKPYGRTPC